MQQHVLTTAYNELHIFIARSDFDGALGLGVLRDITPCLWEPTYHRFLIATLCSSGISETNLY